VYCFDVRFPPPIRISAPLLALAFGLLATFLNYRLNLTLDLTRHLNELRARSDSSGRRLAQASERLINSGELDLLEAQVETMPDLPEEESVGVIDENKRIVVDSTGALGGLPVDSTPLAPVAALIGPDNEATEKHGENEVGVLNAYPFKIRDGAIGWALLKFNRAAAIAAARADARIQLGWMALAMAFLGCLIWGVLHIGFARRLSRLAHSVEAFGRGETTQTETLRGGDEVAALSTKFAGMIRRLRERETEQVRLEREVLEISDNERRRIGQDVHDSLGQRLTAAALATNALAGELKSSAPKLANQAEEIGRELRDAITEARSISHGLAPVDLIDDGLMTALGRLAEDTSRASNIRCIFECAPAVCVANPKIAGHLYRIAQEAVANALTHAAASEIRIGLECHNGSLLLEVEDDGEGFDEATASNGGIGLSVMRYRARLIDARFNIGAAPAGGTRVSSRVQVPV
jgi:signal transduction histidine kinase